MNIRPSIVALVVMTALSGQAMAQLILYQNDDFNGQTFSTQRAVNNFSNRGFNDQASSVIVLSDRWEVCDDAGFRGRCMVLRPGRYPDLTAMGLDNRISSARMVGRNANFDDERYAPPPIPAYDNRRRSGERLFWADVTSVRAVVGPPEQRCWTEREHVAGDQSSNVPGAIVGALVGGVLGHQVGGGTGKDIATVGGAVAGGVLGANAGDRSRGYDRDVQRCTNSGNSSRAEYWDVTYDFRGRGHRIQMTSPPGDRLQVNRDGEPRS